MSDLEIDAELALTNLQELEHKYFKSAEGGLANLSIRVIKGLRQQLTTLQAEKERLEGELGRYREALNYYANKVQWVKLTEQSEFSIVFIAGQLWDMDGWAVAERALNPEPDFEDGPEFEGWAERAGINEHPTQEPTNGN